MIRILNLTQHDAVPEQIEAGVIEPSKSDKEWIKTLITFDEIPTKQELAIRAISLVGLCEKYQTNYALVGGAAFFASKLEQTLKNHDIHPVYAFSKRQSVDSYGPEGPYKISKFVHLGFFEP